MSTRSIFILIGALVLLAIGGVIGCQMHAHFNPVDAVPLIGKTDTIVSRETIRVPVPFPAVIEDAGTVTVKPRTNSDTAKIASSSPGGISTPQEVKKDDTPTLRPSGDLDIPITRKTYQGDDFRAVVSGWRPNLDSLTVFPKTTTVTTEKIVFKKSLFSVTVGPAVIYDGKKVTGGLALTAGFTLFSR